MWLLRQAASRRPTLRRSCTVGRAKASRSLADGAAPQAFMLGQAQRITLDLSHGRPRQFRRSSREVLEQTRLRDHFRATRRAQGREIARTVLRGPEACGKPPANQVVRQFCEEHSERYLLAFVYGHLGEHDLLRVRTDAEKFLLLAVLNLVECIAFVGTHTSSE